MSRFFDVSTAFPSRGRVVPQADCLWSARHGAATLGRVCRAITGNPIRWPKVPNGPRPPGQTHASSAM